MDDKRMFAQLMEEEPRETPDPKPTTALPTKPDQPTTGSGDPSLPHELEDLGAVGYTSHSYRLTETELRWLRRFCLRMSERLDKTVSHNTLIRLLLRLADQEWSQDPEHNRLLDFLSRLKN